MDENKNLNPEATAVLDAAANIEGEKALECSPSDESAACAAPMGSCGDTAGENVSGSIGTFTEAAPLKPVTRTGLSASTLRLLAMAFMLADHICHVWTEAVPASNWMIQTGRNIGRMAFPIFAFQIVEGFYHTADRKRYAKRLLLLALVSEIPFNLLSLNLFILPIHQNTVFTLLLGLAAIAALDWAKKERTSSAAAKAGLAAGFTCLLAHFGFVDYGWRGVMIVIAFYIFHEGRFSKAGQLAVLFLVNVVFFRGVTIPIFGGAYELPRPALSLLALIPIWLYDGRKGFGGKRFQTAAYLFYPVHIVVLDLIRVLF